MRRRTLAVWLLVPLVGMAGRVAVAQRAPIPPAVFPAQRVMPLPGAHWATGPRPEVVPVAYQQPEIIPPAPALPPQPAIPPDPLTLDALTLDELQAIALQSNPTLVQAGLAVRAARGAYLQAGLYPNPGIGYAGGDMGLEGTSGQQGAVVSQEFVTAGKRRLGRAVAGHDVQLARWDWEVQQLRVLNDVRAGFYEVLLAQRTIDISRQLAEIGQSGLEATEKLLAAEEVSRADVLQAGIEAEAANLNLHESQDRHRAAWRRLAGLLGRPQMEAAPLDGDVDSQLPELQWDATLSQLWAQSPELAKAHAGVKRAECELALQYAQRIPNFEVEVWAKHDATVEDTLVDVGVGLPLPLFDRNQGNIIKAQAELNVARNEVRRVELDLRDRLIGVFEQYMIARRRVEAYRNSILPKARASVDMVRTGYREGEFGYLALLTVQRTFFNANLEYLESLGRLWAGVVEIDGMLLSGGLQGVGE